MTDQTLFIPVVPVAKPRMTQRDKWAQRPAVMRYRQFKDELRANFNPGPNTATNRLAIIFHVPVKPSWSKKKQQLHIGKAHEPKPDRDNYEKAFWDAVYPENDSAVWCAASAKIWAPENGGGIEIMSLPAFVERVSQVEILSRLN